MLAADSIYSMVFPQKQSALNNARSRIALTIRQMLDLLPIDHPDAAKMHICPIYRAKMHICPIYRI